MISTTLRNGVAIHMRQLMLADWRGLYVYDKVKFSVCG